MGAHRGRAGPASARTPPWGRMGHPSRCLTIVHDGGDRVDTVTLWLSAPRMAHLGDEVGWPRGGLAPSATYSVRMAGGGFLGVVAGRLESWRPAPGPEPVLTPSGELHVPVRDETHNVIPLRRAAPASAFASASASASGEWPAAGLTCPCRTRGRPRLAGEEDERRERERARREGAIDFAHEMARTILELAARPDGSLDVAALVSLLRAELAGDVAIGALAQRLATALPADAMSTVLRQLAARPEAGRATSEGRPGLEAAMRVFAQRALAVHGASVLDALPARFVADGMAAEALVLPRLERMLARALPGDLGRLARRSLHGLDEALGDVDPGAIRMALFALGAVT
jgi:hypothetical protein